MKALKNILVTGGAGFIGSHLMELLLKEQYNVTCVDNFDNFYARSIKQGNIASCIELPNFKMRELDVRDNSLRNIFSEGEFDLVVHLAVKPGVRPSITHPEDYFSVNVNGTVHVLELMREFGIKNFIFASSSSVYGNSSKFPYSETDTVDFPISPYAATKRSGELLTYTYHHLYNINVLNLRFFTVYGPRQRPDLAVHKFFECLYKNRAIDIYGDGNSARDYTYVTDTVQGIIAAINYLKKKDSVYEIVNLGNSHPVSLKELITSMEEITHKKFEVNYLPMQPGDVNYTCADIEKAQNLLNYNPRVSLSEGLQFFKTWYEANKC